MGRTGLYYEVSAALLYLGYENNMAAKIAAAYSNKRELTLNIPIYIGKDDEENFIYTLGVGKEVNMAERTIKQFVNILGFSDKELIVKKIVGKGEKILEIISRFLPPGFLRERIAYFLILGNMKNIRKQIKIEK